MTNRKPTILPAMTAIAAAIACSTPSFAQTANPPSAETPAPVVADPVVAAPIVPDTPVAADTIAPAEAVATPAARRATTARPPTARSRPTPVRPARAAPTAAAPTAAVPAPAAASAAPVAEAPVVEPLPAPPVAEPVAAPVEAADTSMMDGVILPLAAGGLAILALAGVGLALRRRKRRAAEDEEAAMREAELAAIDDSEPTLIAEPETQPEPVRPTFVAAPALATPAAPMVPATPVADPTPDVEGPLTELPEDFDLSRFGYHVQEAYKGPTEDNPSLSLKNRLTRARGMDQLERNLDAEVEAATGEPVLTEAELSPPADVPSGESAVDPAKGERDLPPSSPDQKPAMHPAYPK